MGPFRRTSHRSHDASAAAEAPARKRHDDPKRAMRNFRDLLLIEDSEVWRIRRNFPKCKRQLTDKQTTVNYTRSVVRPSGRSVAAGCCTELLLSDAQSRQSPYPYFPSNCIALSRTQARAHSGSPLSRSARALSFMHLHPHRALAVGIANVRAATPLCAWPSGAHPCAGASHCSAREESQQRSE